MKKNIVGKILLLCLYVVLACLGVTFAWMSSGAVPIVDNIGLFFNVPYDLDNGQTKEDNLVVQASSITFEVFVLVGDEYISTDDLDEDFVFQNLLPGEPIRIRFDFHNTSPITSSCKFLLCDMTSTNDLIFTQLYFGITSNTYPENFDIRYLPEQIYVNLADPSISNIESGVRNTTLFETLYVPHTGEEECVSIYGYILFSRLATMEEYKNISFTLGNFRAIIS